VTQGPLEKAISRRQDLLTENSELRARIDRNTGEIAQIDSALVVMRKFAPLGQLPGLDEDVESVYGDLASMTVPDGLDTILYKRGEPLTSRELLTVLEKAGKLDAGNKNNLIGVIGALKRHPNRFRKVGNTWTPVERNHQLRVLDGADTRGAEG
jgi:hypothetical protein